MTVARHYVMTAAQGKAEELRQALTDAAGVIRKVPGCQGIELLRDAENANRFVFIERWNSIEAHREAREHLPKGSLDAVMAAVEGPPEGSYLDCLKSW